MGYRLLEIDSSSLPMIIKMKGETGNYVQFILKPAGRKLGAQLVKADSAMLQQSEQN